MIIAHVVHLEDKYILVLLRCCLEVVKVFSRKSLALFLGFAEVDDFCSLRFRHGGIESVTSL